MLHNDQIRPAPLIASGEDFADEIELINPLSGISTEPRPTVSVIIPTMNEANNLPLVLPFLPMNWIDEVILVDGRSTDNTVEVAKRLLPSIKVVLETRKGKGIAMRSGYEASSGDILIVMDADGSNDPREIPRFISALLEGGDFAKGSRFAHGGGTTDMPRIRMLGNGFFVVLSNLLFNVNFTDLCYGYHAFWRNCLTKIDLDNYDGFEIDTALYLNAVRARLRVVEVPSFEGYRFHGMGKLQTIPDGIRVLRTIAKQWGKWIVSKEEQLHLGFRGIRYTPPEVFSTNKFLQTKSKNLNRILEIVQLLSILTITGSDIKDVLTRTLKIILDEFNADGGSVILLNEHGEVRDGCFVSEASAGHPESSSWSEVLENGIAGWVVTNQQPVLIPDTSKDARWVQRDWDQGNRSALSLPLFIGGLVVGALTLVRSNQNHFTSHELETLMNINIKNAITDLA